LITLVKIKLEVKLPAELLNSLTTTKGFNETAFVNAHLEEERITSVRVNPFKPIRPEFETGRQVPWCDTGVYLDVRPLFTFDPLFHAGCYYVQEAGSMFIHHALKQSIDLNKDQVVLDLCAAPGGKSTLINSLITENSILISNEVIRNRSDVLSQNLGKWGTCNTAVTNCDPSVFSKLPQVFDVIMADVPCSGSGLFRKQPGAISEWSTDHVTLCSARQKRILGDVLGSLKINGTLIYSTCSYSKEENEDIVKWLINEFDMELLPLAIDGDWGIVNTDFGYRFYPHLTKSEGFFCAVLRKNQGEEIKSYRGKKIQLEKATGKELQVLNSFVVSSEKQFILKFKNEFKLVNRVLSDFFDQYGKDLYFKKLGTVIGELKHNDLLPDHELAHSIYVNTQVNRAELTRAEAVAFLKKENLKVAAEKGICLMSYKNYGLGWAKILDQRLNNYLPKHSRILSNEED
jgi:16S rRNA C967 or C1407 C5-methylase (RsmB/RsmF family)/NOL1/NOP2/fmu family ribosome biogenesis protein